MGAWRPWLRQRNSMRKNCCQIWFPTLEQRRSVACWGRQQHLNIIRKNTLNELTTICASIFSLYYIDNYIQVTAGTQKGKELDEIMKQGKLVPNEDVLILLEKAIHTQADTAKGFLIDGFVLLNFIYHYFHCICMNSPIENIRLLLVSYG